MASQTMRRLRPKATGPTVKGSRVKNVSKVKGTRSPLKMHKSNRGYTQMG